MSGSRSAAPSRGCPIASIRAIRLVASPEWSPKNRSRIVVMIMLLLGEWGAASSAPTSVFPGCGEDETVDRKAGGSEGKKRYERRDPLDAGADAGPGAEG